MLMRAEEGAVRAEAYLGEHVSCLRVPGLQYVAVEADRVLVDCAVEHAGLAAGARHAISSGVAGEPRLGRPPRSSRPSTARPLWTCSAPVCRMRTRRAQVETRSGRHWKRRGATPDSMPLHYTGAHPPARLMVSRTPTAHDDLIGALDGRPLRRELCID